MTRSATVAIAFGASLLGAASARPGQVPVFPTEVELVTVDVVALDEKGQALRGLAPDDFALTEDGRAQTIVSFEAVQWAGIQTGLDPRPSPVATNEGPAEHPGGAFVLLVDDLGLDALRLPRLVTALHGLLETAFLDGDEVTLATVSGSLWWSIRFPEGREDLPLLLAKVKGRRAPETSLDLMSDYEAYQIANFEGRTMGGGDSLPRYLSRVARRWTGSACLAIRIEACAHLVQAEAAERDNERRARTRALLATVERAVFSLTGVRGRKELLLFSAGFVTDVGRDEARQVAGICREANVVVNFLDARGTLLRMTEGSAGFTGNPPDPLELGEASFEQPQDEIGGALDLVEDTGGLAVTGTDDYAAGTRRILDESRVYYMLGYHPPPGKGPRDWRKVKVEVKRPRAKVRSRKGYTLRPSGAAVGALFPEGSTNKGGKKDPPSLPRLDSLDIDRALSNTHVGRALPLRALPYVLDERTPGKLRVQLAVEVDERALFRSPSTAGTPATLRMVVQAAHRDSGEAFRDDQRLSLSPPTSRAPAWTTFYHELDLAPGVAQVRVVVREEASRRLGAVTMRVDVPARGGLRLATPILADELRAPLAAGSSPRVIVPAHRVFSKASGALYCQILVLGAVASEPTGAPEVEASYVLRRPNGPDVSRSTPSLIAVAPGGPVARLLTLPLGTLSNGEYELVLRARDRTNGSTVERLEPFRVDVDRSRAAAEGSEEAARTPVGDVPRAGPGPGRPPATAEPPAAALKDLLRAAGEYVVAFGAEASGVVLEEVYTQRLRSGMSRVLTSDFVLVSLPGEVGVMGFRDVFRVDGRAVRDRDQRLERIFLSPSARGVAQARAVLDEGARFNLGPTQRNFNVPTLALAVLRPELQSRFKFRDGGARVRRGREVREVEYQEIAKPTLVRDPEKDRDHAARGRFLIVPETGEVMRSEMRFDHEGGRTEISVDYAWDAALGLWLPATMSEQDDNRIRGPSLPGAPSAWGGDSLLARAQYGKARRFVVTTEEKVKNDQPPPP